MPPSPTKKKAVKEDIYENIPLLRKRPGNIIFATSSLNKFLQIK